MLWPPKSKLASNEKGVAPEGVSAAKVFVSSSKPLRRSSLGIDSVLTVRLESRVVQIGLVEAKVPGRVQSSIRVPNAK